MVPRRSAIGVEIGEPDLEGARQARADVSCSLMERAMKLVSGAFADGTAIPRRFTCDGENLSPPLQWSDAPAGTLSFVLLCDDPGAPAGTHGIIGRFTMFRQS
jgi:phosphatidylethanolamine-binding protein (PEBP) family uncharacterized protein